MVISPWVPGHSLTAVDSVKGIENRSSVPDLTRMVLRRVRSTALHSPVSLNWGRSFFSHCRLLEKLLGMDFRLRSQPFPIGARLPEEDRRSVPNVTILVVLRL